MEDVLGFANLAVGIPSLAPLVDSFRTGDAVRGQSASAHPSGCLRTGPAELWQVPSLRPRDMLDYRRRSGGRSEKLGLGLLITGSPPLWAEANASVVRSPGPSARCVVRSPGTGSLGSEPWAAARSPWPVVRRKSVRPNAAKFANSVTKRQLRRAPDLALHETGST